MLAYLVDYMGERLVFVTLFVLFFWRFLALAQSLKSFPPSFPKFSSA